MRRYHPMLHVVHHLLGRELDRMDLVEPVFLEQLDYMRALMSLHDSLRGHEQATILHTPGFTIKRDGDWPGETVVGWHHVLVLPDGSKIHPKDEISWHHYRWTAKRAANRWLKRAQIVSSRISTELSQALEGAR